MEGASLLHGVYMVAAVFGVGVTVVDFLGLLGSGDHDGDGAHDGGDHHGGDYQAGAEGLAESGGQHGQSSVLLLMRRLRLAVYFSLGFGVLGLAAEATGSGVLGSLAWALPGGAVCALLARAVFRFQQRDVDSSLKEGELLLQRGEVIVPLSHADMGRIRLRMGQFTVERYALAEDDDGRYEKAQAVEVVRISDECVYVRRVPALPHA